MSVRPSHSLDCTRALNPKLTNLINSYRSKTRKKRTHCFNIIFKSWSREIQCRTTWYYAATGRIPWALNRAYSKNAFVAGGSTMELAGELTRPLAEFTGPLHGKGKGGKREEKKEKRVTLVRF